MSESRRPERLREARRRDAERVVDERREELPSQRDIESPEGGRPPRQTQWDEGREARPRGRTPRRRS